VAEREDIPDPHEGLGKAARSTGGDFYRAWKAAIGGGNLERARGMIELHVQTIAAGEAWAPEFLSLPAHLPDGPKEQQVLALSKTKDDAELRQDLIGWASENRLRASRSAKALEILVLSYREAQEVLADPDCVDEELSGWLDQLDAHLESVYGVHAADAPDDVAAWAAGLMAKRNPSPPWLTGSSAMSIGSTFQPRPRPKLGGHHHDEDD
jgi:hypothetical protein